MAPTAPAPLSQLPPEIRSQIYSHLPPTGLLPLASTCYQLYHETQTLFYARYVFTLEPLCKVAELDTEEVGAHDKYQTVLRRLVDMSREARASLHRASLIVSCPAEYQHGAEAVRRAIKILRTHMVLHNLVVTFDVPGYGIVSLYDGGPRVVDWLPLRSVWHPLRRLMMKSIGLPACKTLVRRFSEPQENMRYLVIVCECIAKTLEKGSFLNNLEIWLSRESLKDWNLDLAKVTDIVRAAETWNNRCPEWVEWDQPYWLLCLTRIRGLERFKILLYNPLESISAQSIPVKPLQLEGLQEFLDGIMVVGDAAIVQDPRLDFHFETGGSLASIKY